MLPVSKNGIMLPHKWRTKSVLEIIGMAFSAFICCFETPLNWRSHYDHVLFSCLISFTFLWLQLHKTLHLHYHTEMHLNLSTRFPQYQCERSRCQGCFKNQVDVLLLPEIIHHKENVNSLLPKFWHHLQCTTLALFFELFKTFISFFCALISSL